MLIDLDVPRATPRRARAWWKAPAVAALLLTLGGSAVPAGPPRLAPVLDTGNLAAAVASVFTEDALYTARTFSTAESEIRAWPLRPGGPHWTVRLPGQVFQLTGAGAVLLADAGWSADLAVLDPKSGARLWRSGPGSLTALLGSKRIAVATPSSGGLGRLQVVDLGTGREIWSRDADANKLLAAGEQSLVVVDFAYRATAFAADSGRELVHDRDLGVALGGPGRTDPDAFTGIKVVGDQLYVYGGNGLAAFRAADLARRWNTTVGLPLDLVGCATSICLLTPESMAVLDPRSGALRWTDHRFRSITADGLATDRDGRSALIDPLTGRIVKELGNGNLILRADETHSVLTDRRGVLPPVAVARCTTAGPYLACPTGNNRTEWTVWQIRPAPRS